MSEEQTITLKRSCDGCTVCCEGYVSANIYGYPMHPGKPCHFAGCNGCSIYEHRPEDPCKKFECLWLNSAADYPEWLKPSESKCLIITREALDPEGKSYTCRVVLETGAPMGAKELLFFVNQHLESKIPLYIQVNNFMYWFGPPGWKVNL